MGFLQRKKSSKKNLLGSSRGDKSPRSDDVVKKSLSRRIFGKKEQDVPPMRDDPTPPVTPETPLSVMVVTTESRGDSKDMAHGDETSVSGTTISDLSHSVAAAQRHDVYYSNPVEIPDFHPSDKELPPPSYAAREDSRVLTDSYAGTANTGYTSNNTSTDEQAQSTAIQIAPDASPGNGDVVTSLLGMFEDACKTPFNNDTPARRDASPIDAPPTWGMPPSQDDDSVAHIYEKQPLEEYERTVQKPKSPEGPVYHENFELVLEEGADEDRKPMRALNWIPGKKKGDDKEATYLAVFGADPDKPDAKKESKASLTVRMCQTLHKIPEETEEEERKMETTRKDSVDNFTGASPLDGKKSDTQLENRGGKERDRKAKIIRDIQKVTKLQDDGEDRSVVSKEKEAPPGHVRSTPPTSKSSSDHKPHKPLWKSVMDKKTGRSYYYHRFTRQTTWTKPAGFDEQLKVKKTRSKTRFLSVDPVEMSGPEKSMSGADWQNNTAVTSQLGTEMTIGSPDAKRKEIRRLLMDMAPPDPSSVDQLIQQYDGREDELLTQLRDLVQSQPFDEPLKKTGSFASEDLPPALPGGNEEKRDVVLGSIPVIPSASMKTRTRTTTTHATGQTTKTDKTQKISNVATRAAAGTSIITQTSETNTSLTSDRLIVENPVISSSKTEKKKVLRDRELHVEEFTTKRYGLRTEKFSGHAIHNKSRNSGQPRGASNNTTYKSETEDDSRYLADNDEPYHYDTDSISALSTPESDFMMRKDRFEASRRKTLDNAIQNKDWELAAVVTEDMRGASFDSADGSAKVYRGNRQFHEWTQSELDKFISENDWDAVARYIANMRDSNNAKASRKANRKQVGSPQKGIGAQSRLQQLDMRPTSSVASDASPDYSDDYSSATSNSSEELRYRKNQEFRC